MTDPLEIKEREKYQTIWEGNNYQSGNQRAFAQFIKDNVNFDIKSVIELGCGDAKLYIQMLLIGMAYEELSYLGVDITTQQIKKPLSNHVLQRPI